MVYSKSPLPSAAQISERTSQICENPFLCSQNPGEIERMKKSYWFMICALDFSILSTIFARIGNQLMIYLLGMAGWMAYKGIRESWKEMRLIRWMRRAGRRQNKNLKRRDKAEN